MDLFPWIPGIVSSAGAALDRKSTRLNSSHSQISYAVFCLKKKKKELRYNSYKAAVQSMRRGPAHKCMCQERQVTVMRSSVYASNIIANSSSLLVSEQTMWQ